VTKKPDITEPTTSASLGRLADREREIAHEHAVLIKSYWAERNYDIRVEVVRLGSDNRPIYGVRSNLSGRGLPPGEAA
jgi:hypothetical protein